MQKCQQCKELGVLTIGPQEEKRIGKIFAEKILTWAKFLEKKPYVRREPKHNMQSDHDSSNCEACKAGYCESRGNSMALKSHLAAQKKFVWRPDDDSDDDPFQRVNERPKAMPVV